MSDDKKFVNMALVRRDDQRDIMNKIVEDGVCPFCLENLEKYHKAPIIKEGEFWILTDNQWPYKKIKNQLLMIYKKHVEHINDIDPKAGQELFEMCIKESRKRKIQGGGLAMRFGTSPLGNYGSSVSHIHAHLIEPDLEALEETEAWRFKFGQPLNYKKE